jgi:PAS domain S-box-containing protein
MKNKMNEPAIAWCMALIIFSSPSYSQMSDMQFERISTESGLSQSSVLCICHDSKGFLWFGTHGGINRYDGYRFKVFKNDSKNPYSLSNNSANYIIEDHLGILWVGTEDGLSCFDRENEKFICYKNDPGNVNSLSNNFIRYVYEDRSGTLWVGTNGGGLNQFDREKKKFIRYLSDPKNLNSLVNNNVLSIIEDNQKRLWIGTDGGLNLFDRVTKEFTRYVNDPQNPNSISPYGIGRIYEDHSGNLWLGTWGGGLNKFNPITGIFIHYQNNPNDPTSLSDNFVLTIHEDRNGNLWIGTASKGLNIFVPDNGGKGRGTFIHYQNDPTDAGSLSGNNVLSIYEDKVGILWIGTNYGGINKYNPCRRQFVLYRNHPNDANSLSRNTIQAILEDSKGMIWIGTNGGGLDCLDRKKNKFTHYVNNPKDPNSLSNNLIRNICEDRYNKLWIGTVDGLNYFDRKTGKFIYYRNDPTNHRSISNNIAWSVYNDRAGNIWTGTFGGGLNKFDYAKGEFIHYVHDPNDPKSISDNIIWTMYEDSSGILWIGTHAGGLDQFNPKTGIFSHFQTNNQDSTSISSNKVLCLYEDHTGVLWVGTVNGLNKFDRATGTFHRYGESDGLSNNNIQGILEDDHGNLWISTNNGLSKFNPRTLKFKNYDETYGLQSNEFAVNTCCKLKSGEMVFGGMNGLNIFNPNSIKEDTTLPAVVITDFQIFNKSVAIGENAEGRTILKKSISECNEINLSYKENVFSFEFAGLHYTSPKGNLYAYMMEGFEKEWNYTDANRRFVTYTNLPGGNYTFRVKASNNQGKWNEVGTSVRIIISPPFWKTMWFYGLLLIALGVIVYWIYQWQMQARDFAAQRRMEAAITNERNLLRTLIDHLPDAVYVKDIQCRKVISNLADVRCMSLQSEAEALGKDDFELFPKELAEGFIADDRAVIQTGRPVIDREEYITDEEGRKHLLITSKIPLRDEKGQTIGLVGIGRDITERKRIEQDIRKLFHAVEQSPASVMITNTKGEIEYINPKFTEITGYTMEEVVRKNPRILKSGETSNAEYAQLWQSITAGKEWKGEFHNKKKNGELFWETALISPIFDEHKTITHFLALKEDITEKKKMQSQLLQSQKVESIGTLAGGIAHDFNNILGIILAYSSVLERAEVDHNKLEASIKAINSAVSRGAALVRQILTFARQTEIAIRPMSVPELAHEVIMMLQETFPKVIEFKEEFGRGVPLINADHTQIHQAILNLCVNARDAMPNGGLITIGIATYPLEKIVQKFPGATYDRYVCLSVSDTGTGMNEATKNRIFDPFFTTKEFGKGTGLGLSVVYGVMQSHQGFVSVESEVDKGTTFYLYLPVPQEAKKDREIDRKKSGTMDRGTETILFVEDEELLRTAMVSTLESNGYTVYVAVDGWEAVEVYRQHQKEIKLVLTDMGLPKKTGLDVFLELRQINPTLKTILASGFISLDQKSELLKTGAIEFIQKPYVLTDVLQKIKEVLDKK